MRPLELAGWDDTSILVHVCVYVCMFLQTQGHTEQSSEIKWRRKQKQIKNHECGREGVGGRLRQHGLQ